MTSPLITLLAYALGLGAGVALLVGLLSGRPPGARGWALAAVAVAVVALGAGLPAKLRDGGYVFDQQRRTYAGTDERAAREKCLNDNGRPDLVEALAFARERMPEQARFYVTSTHSVACIMINLFPRRPVRPADLDPARDWQVLDGTIPAPLQDELPDPGDADPAGRYLVHSPSFVLVRPGEEVAE